MAMHPDLANRMKIGGTRPNDDANQQPAEDRSHGFLDRAMNAGTMGGEPEIGAQVSRADKGTMGTTIHGDGRVETWKSKAITGSTKDMATGSNVFSEILSPSGDQRQMAQDMTPDSVVKLSSNGMSMSLQSALTSGMVTKNPDGSYSEGPEGGGGGTQGGDDDDDKEPHPDLAAEFLPSDEAEAIITELVQNTSVGDQIEIIQQLTSGEGVVDQHLLDKAAGDARLEPDALASKMETVRASMLVQASAVVAKHGVDPEAVWLWSNEHHLPELQKAARRHAMHGTPAVYNSIAEAYILALPEHDPELILNSDFGGQGRAHKDTETGAIIITDASGRTYSWQSAVRAGIIKLS